MVSLKVFELVAIVSTRPLKGPMLFQLFAGTCGPGRDRTADDPLKRELASVCLARGSAQEIGSSNHAGGVIRTRDDLNRSGGSGAAPTEVKC